MSSPPDKSPINPSAKESLSDEQAVKRIADRLDNLWQSNTAKLVARHSLQESGFQIGRYVIENVVGSGGFGVVYRAQEVDSEEIVALKIPRPEVLADPEKLRRFENEAQLSANLDHPFIVPVLDFKLQAATPYIASEFCDGPNLSHWLAGNESPIPPRQAAKLVAQIAHAIHYAHQQGIVHRDLKPANIILVIEGIHSPNAGPGSSELGHFSPRVTDFGLAQFQQQVLQDTRSSILIGSPVYMSPEQAEGRHQEVGPRADVFAMGAILYEMLTGIPPFAADSYPAVLSRLRDDMPTLISKQNPLVDRDLETICLKCLEKPPADRFDSAADLANDLNRYLAGQPIVAARTSLFRRAHRWTQQAGRLRDAMSVVISISALRIVFAFFGILMISISESQIAAGDIFSAIVAHLLFTTPCELVIGYAAWRNANNSLPQWAWRAISVLLFAWALVALTVAITPSLAPTWYQANPGARITTFTLLAVLFAAQALCWLVSVLANRD
jgi:serine/threonine protein kinase